MPKEVGICPKNCTDCPFIPIDPVMLTRLSEKQNKPVDTSKSGKTIIVDAEEQTFWCSLNPDENQNLSLVLTNSYLCR